MPNAPCTFCAELMTIDQDMRAFKSTLRQRMLSLEAAELTTAQEQCERFLADARRGDRAQHDNSDIAEARENADLAAAFDHPVKHHNAKIDVLENLDISVTQQVRPGAVVGFNGRYLVVAVATAQFEHEGVSYMGISPRSPIYLAMDGLAVGDCFLLNGKETTIDEVF